MKDTRVINESVKDIEISGGMIESLRFNMVDDQSTTVNIEGDLREYQLYSNGGTLNIETIESGARIVKSERDLPRIQSLEINIPKTFDGKIEVEAISTHLSLMCNEEQRFKKLSFEGVNFDINLGNVYADVETEAVNATLSARGFSGSIESNGVNNTLILKDIMRDSSIAANGKTTKIIIDEQRNSLNYKVKLNGLTSKVRYHGQNQSGFGTLRFTSPNYDSSQPVLSIKGNGVTTSVEIA